LGPGPQNKHKEKHRDHFPGVAMLPMVLGGIAQAIWAKYNPK